MLTIEPVERTRQARVNQGWLSKFLESHAFSFDWNDWSFRLSKPEDRSGVLDLEVFESRTAKGEWYILVLPARKSGYLPTSIVF